MSRKPVIFSLLLVCLSNVNASEGYLRKVAAIPIRYAAPAPPHPLVNETVVALLDSSNPKDTTNSETEQSPAASLDATNPGSARTHQLLSESNFQASAQPEVQVPYAIPSGSLEQRTPRQGIEEAIEQYHFPPVPDEIFAPSNAKADLVDKMLLYWKPKGAASTREGVAIPLPPALFNPPGARSPSSQATYRRE